MEAKDFKKVILFMANAWDKKTAIIIFGNNMGTHFWNKWCGSCKKGEWLPDYATMRLFYEMSDNYLQRLLDYVDNFYHGC